MANDSDDSEQDISGGSELGEDELFEHDEGGEDELFEEKSEDINYGTVIKEDALAYNQSDEDSEEDIIASTIKKKQDKKAAGVSVDNLQKEFDQKSLKKQKVF